MRAGIALTSLALTTAVISNAFYQKRQFYPSVVYITKSNPSMAIIYVQAFLFVIFLGKLMQKIFFGQILAAEFEHLMDRSWYAVTETCLAFTVFRDDISPTFLAFFTTLLFLKAFHWLAEDRVDFMERSPVISLIFHVRLISLIIVLGVIDIQFVSHAYQSTILKGASTQLVFGFEYAVLFTIVINIATKYTLHTIDLHADTPWENKAVFLLYTELVMGFFRVVLYLSFLVIMVRIYTLPLFITRPMYLALRAFKRAFNDVIMSRRAIRNMNTLYPDATPEELAAADNVCIICREEMTGASKKLPCNHIFHTACLRSWFQRQQTCPTCRHNILRSGSSSTTGARRQEANGAPAAAGAPVAPPGAPAGAPPGTPPGAQQGGGIPPGPGNQAAGAGADNQQGQQWPGQIFGGPNPLMNGFFVNAMWQQLMQQRQHQQAQSSQPQGAAAAAAAAPGATPATATATTPASAAAPGTAASGTQGPSTSPESSTGTAAPSTSAGTAGPSRPRGIPTLPPFPLAFSCPFLCPPFPPYVVPPPAPPAPPSNLSSLSDAELKELESASRDGVLARLQYLKNIQTMLDAASVMMNQYSAAAAMAGVPPPGQNESQGATAQGATAQGATAQGATAQGATAQGATAQGASAQSASAQSASAQSATAEKNAVPSTSSVGASAERSAESGEATAIRPSSPVTSKLPDRTDDVPDDPATREQNELRRKRLQRFANDEGVD